MTVKAYVSDFSISLPPLTMGGKLLPVRASSAGSGFSLTCPTCEHGVGVKQQYVCHEGHGPFTAGELGKGKKVGDTLVKLDAEQIKQATESDLPLNYLELTVHPADQVESRTYPGANAYMFTPKHTNKQYAAFRETISDPEFAFVGVCNLRNNETLVRVVSWNGILVAQQLLYPEDINEAGGETAPPAGEFRDIMRQVIEKQKEPFDVQKYKNERKERLAALTAESTEAAGITITTKLSDDDQALEAMKEWLESQAS